MFSSTASRFTLIAAVVATSILVQGCSAPPQKRMLQKLEQEQEHPEEREAAVANINAEHSFAWNIRDYMGYHKVKDEYLDDDAYRKINEEAVRQKNAKAKGASVGDALATGYTAAAAVGKAPWTKGLTLDLLGSVFTSSSIYRPQLRFLTAIPVDKAKDAVDAQNTFFWHIMEAYKKAAVEEGFANAQIETSTVKNESTLKRDIILPLELTATNEAENISIDFSIEGGTRANRPYEGWQSTLPKWISGKSQKSWIIGSFATPCYTVNNQVDPVGLRTNTEPADLKRIQLLERFANYLPDGTYMFVPSLRIGKTKKTAPYVTDNKRKYFFVMPKSAQKQKGESK